MIFLDIAEHCSQTLYREKAEKETAPAIGGYREFVYL